MAYQWTDAQAKSFAAVKDIILSPRVVSYFDPKLPTTIYCDASRLFGLGYCLTQKRTDDSLALVQCSSRSLTSAEQRYSVTELEALALVFAIKDSKYYLHHAPRFTVITDHRALCGLWAKDLHQIENARLQRLREKVNEYVFDVVWQPGKVLSLIHI